MRHSKHLHKHKLIHNLILCMLLVLSASSVYGQKIKKLPQKFLAPVAFDNEEDRINYITKTGKSTKNYRWIVVSDRNDNELYSKPNGAPNGSVMSFGEPMYVVKEAKEWVEVANGPRKDDFRFEEVRKSGWIKKQDILLWPYGLRDPRTGISKKAFLLNKAEEIDRILSESDYQTVRIFDGPNSSKQIGDRGIYNVYFVLKEEQGRSLLSASIDLSNESTVRDYLLGWVDNRRIEKWNQRLVLECNWEKDNYDARKQSKTYVVGLSNQSDADTYSKFGGAPKNVLWDNDPASGKLSAQMRSEENERRAVGTIFRFPVFNMTSGYVNSGAINSIPTRKKGSNTIDKVISEQEFIKIQNFYDRDVKPKRFNVNVGFLIEGSEKMASYKRSILAAIESVDDQFPTDVNIDYGVAIYRDAMLTSKNDLKIKRMTKNKASISSFVNDAVFSDYTDPDNYTNFRYAMSEFINKGGFSTNELNIIICIGASADFYYDVLRRKSAASKGHGKQLIKSENLEKLYAKLASNDINLGFMQVEKKPGKAFSKYGSDARSMLVNISQNQYAKYKNVANNIGTVLKPSIPDLSESSTVELKNALGYGGIYIPNNEAKVSEANIVDFVSESVSKSFKKYDGFYKTMKRVIEGYGLSSDDVSDEFAPLIWDVLSRLDTEQQQVVLNEKIKLYTKIYLPKYIDGIGEPYKQVIFMPQSELREYLYYIDALNRAMNQSSDVIRQNLYEVFLEFMQKLSGDKLKKKEINKKGVDELRRLLMGMSTEGYDLSENLGFRIIDVKDKNVVSQEKLLELSERITRKKSTIEAILNQGKDYPYSYTVGDNVYFWLETEVFF